MKLIPLLLTGIVLTSACNDPVPPTQEAQDLEALRGATQAFKDPQVAAINGWGTTLTPCMLDPDHTGGMGIHIGNNDLLGDGGKLDIKKPEVLLYQPGEAGTKILVAVEYAVPYAAHSRDSTPPVLFGQQFHRFDAFQLWGLHVWAWRKNPNGLYADWNPGVTCPGAAAPMPM